MPIPKRRASGAVAPVLATTRVGGPPPALSGSGNANRKPTSRSPASGYRASCASRTRSGSINGRIRSYMARKAVSSIGV